MEADVIARPKRSKWTSIHFPNLEELLLRRVLALPKASMRGFDSTIFSPMVMPLRGLRALLEALTANSTLSQLEIYPCKLDQDDPCLFGEVAKLLAHVIFELRVKRPYSVLLK